MKIKKGQLIALTRGAYSDYCLTGHATALVDFDTDEIIKLFKESGDYLAAMDWDDSGEKSDYGSDDRFVAWLIREEIIEPCAEDAVVEFYIGEYRRVD